MFNASFDLDGKSHSQPRLTALLTCGDNIMPLSWHMPVSKSPFRYAIALRNENHTHELVQNHKEFALNFLDISYQQACQVCGDTHGQNVDKFKLCGLNRKQAMSIESTLIEEAYTIYECSLIEKISYGDHDLFIADVNIILNKEIEDIQPTLFMGKGFYDTLKGEPTRLERSDSV